MDAAQFKAIQILALKAVEDPTYEDTLNKIRRWYSQTYYVPLDRLDDVSDEHVLQVWFEDRFRAMKNSHDEKILQEYDVLKRSIINEKQAKEEESEDSVWEQQMLEEIKSQEGIVLPKKDQKDLNLIHTTPDSMTLSGDDDFYVPEE